MTKFRTVLTLGLCLLTFLNSTGQDIDNIRSEHKMSYYKAFKAASVTESVLPNKWKSGDTLFVTENDFMIYPVYYDETLDLSFGYPIEKGSKIIVTFGVGRNGPRTTYNELMGIRTIGDTTVFGFVPRRNLEPYVNYGQIGETKTDFYDAFTYYLERYQDSIKNKYGLTNHDLNNIIKDLVIDTEGGWILPRNNRPKSIISDPTFTHSDKDALEYIKKKYIENYEISEKGVFCVISFAINEKGKLVDLKFIDELDEEEKKRITNIMSSMPKWEPAVQDGKPLIVLKFLMVNFRK